MDRRERTDDNIEGFLAALDGRQSEIWTALPGYVESFDPATMTCSVQITITFTERKKDGTTQEHEVPLLTDCPVVFPCGGGFTLTYPIRKNDECLVVFGSRCIDGWWDRGGIQKQDRFRMHDLSDGFVIIGPRSRPRALTNVNPTDVELRSDDGTVHVGINGDKVVRIVAPNSVQIVGDVYVTGTIHATTDVLAGTVHLKTHTHQGVSTGTGHTGQPDP